MTPSTIFETSHVVILCHIFSSFVSSLQGLCLLWVGCFTVNCDRKELLITFKIEVNGIVLIVYFLLQWSLLSVTIQFFRDKFYVSCAQKAKRCNVLKFLLYSAEIEKSKTMHRITTWFINYDTNCSFPLQTHSKKERRNLIENDSEYIFCIKMWF